MPKRFKVHIQGVEETFEVEAQGYNQAASRITQDPARFRLNEARPHGVVGIENLSNGKAAFFKIGASHSPLYPISASTAAACMAMAA